MDLNWFLRKEVIENGEVLSRIYKLSDLFTLRRQRNELYRVLQILKAIEQV